LPDNRVFAPGCMAAKPETCKALIEKGKVPAHDATGMYRTKIIADFRFDEKMWLIEGVDFVIRIGEVFPISVIPECLYSHRVNYSSITHSQGDKIHEATEKFKSKTAFRRGSKYEPKLKNERSKLNKIFKHRRYDTILPYAMNSVFQQRLCGNWMSAFRTALISLSLHPCDLLYFKPLLYCLVPLAAINYYRALKSK
jgi:hypothetical protein